MDWEPPGPGPWWLMAEHAPRPVSRLGEAMLRLLLPGWVRAARTYGFADAARDFRAVNGWLYFSPGTAAPVVDDELVAAAEATLSERRWVEEARRWHGDERPRVLAANRALQADDVGALDDEALVAHVGDALAHVAAVAPIHFEHAGFAVAGGLLVEAAAPLGISGAEALGLLAGSSVGSTDAARHLRAIAEALRAGGVGTVGSLADVQAAAPAELAAYLDDHGWRLLAGHDPVEPTVGESPALLVAAVRALREGGHGAVDPPGAPAGLDPDLLAGAGAAYALRDDDVQLCFNWPCGLVRRAVLEVARRRDDLDHPDDLFEATPDEWRADLPAPAELAARRAVRLAAGDVEPPFQLGGGAPPDAGPLPAPVARLHELQGLTWSIRAAVGTGGLVQGTPVGTGVGTGPVRVVVDAADLALVEPGEVLVARATTTAYGPVFPLLAAVVAAEGGLLGHTAILARELGLPAVVGAAGALSVLRTGDVVTVDGDAGVVLRAAGG